MTILIIVLLNLLQPSDTAPMMHKAYPSRAVCEAQFRHIESTMPNDPTVRVMAFCIAANDLVTD